MLKRKAWLRIGILITVMFLAGCATAPGKPDTSFEDQAYKTLYAVGMSYKITWEQLQKLHQQGKIGGADWQVILEARQAFRATYQSAVEALTAYLNVRNAENQEKVNTAIAETARMLTNLTTLLAKGGSKIGT